MKYTKPLSAYEIFMANVEADNDKQILIKSIVEDYDLFISVRPQPGGICAVATLETIFDKYGKEILETTLRLLIATWEGVPQSFSANMLNGVARLVRCYGDELKESTFKEKLSRVSCKELSRLAKDRRNGSLGFSEAMLQLYNKKNQANPLRQNKLYFSPKYTTKDDNTSSNNNTVTASTSNSDSQMDLFNM